MPAKILNGRELAGKLKDGLRQEVAALKSRTGKVPKLINIMIGKDPGTCAYANSQKRVADQIGITYELAMLPEDISQDTLTEHVRKLNSDESVNGIMIHKPVPASIDYHAVANCLDIRKDLEGINVANIGKMLLGETQIIPCTPAAVMEHILSTGASIRGKEAVIVGASEIVGKPLSLLLLQQYATVTVCHVATSEAGLLEGHVRRADILVVAVGKAGVVKGEWIKPGAIVVDVGINQQGERIVGDVVFETAKEKAAYITPVPGGVGPVTVVMLMRNGVEAFKSQVKGVKDKK